MIIRKGCIKNAIKKIHIKRLKKCDKKNYINRVIKNYRYCSKICIHTGISFSKFPIAFPMF